MGQTLRCRAPAGAGILMLLWTQLALGHIDVPRLSLSQLFLSADVVAIAQIEAVEERRFELDGKPTSKQVVSARITQRYKGEVPSTVDFFQEAHGHAHYSRGDTALLFLEIPGAGERLAEIGAAAGVEFISGQVRNTEHRIEADELPEYDAVLSAYANLSDANSSPGDQRAARLKEILLQMLHASSTDLVESGLLDWDNMGSAIQFTAPEVEGLLALTQQAARPIQLRLAILRSLYRKQLVDATAWFPLFRNEPADNLPLVARSTIGCENTALTPYLARLLRAPSGPSVEAAARALGHPLYAGVEPDLASLLRSENQRISYAAVHALVGIGSEEAAEVLRRAQSNHPDPRVRRLIAAQLANAGLA